MRDSRHFRCQSTGRHFRKWRLRPHFRSGGCPLFAFRSAKRDGHREMRLMCRAARRYRRPFPHQGFSRTTDAQSHPGSTGARRRRRLLRLEPSWVPRSFMVPGRRLKLHPDDVYALGGHRGGINERWFSSTTNADNGPGTPAGRGLELRPAGRRLTLPPQGRGRSGRRSAARERRHGAREGLEPALQVLRQPRRHPAPHAPERRAGEAARPARASPRPTTSRRNTTRRSTTFPTRSWASSRARRRPTSAGASRTGTEGDNGILVPVARLPPRARHRLADRSAHPARRPDRSSPTSRR